MSEQFENQKSPKKRCCPIGKKAAIIIGAVVLCIVVALVVLLGGNSGDGDHTVTQARLDNALEGTQEGVFDLGDGLLITELGGYTGAFMEDGSDEAVSDVLMIVVTNNGESTLQYTQITLTGANEEDTAVFNLSTLPVGASAMVLETNRRTYSRRDSFTAATADYVVFFKEELTTCADQFAIQMLDGGFNITNISGADITGKIEIYYKNSSEDMYCGGITYRGSIEGGLQAGEIRQVMSRHFSADNTTIMYINISE